MEDACIPACWAGPDHLFFSIQIPDPSLLCLDSEISPIYDIILSTTGENFPIQSSIEGQIKLVQWLIKQSKY